VRASIAAAVAAIVVLCGQPAEAQVSLRGFGDVGLTRFSASDSFEAVLGESRGMVFGGGGEVVLPRGIFAGVRVSRFQGDGSRVFVSGGEVFDLGIDTTIRVMPIELTGGIRLGGWQRVVPYVGGGVGWHRYEESSDFAGSDEDVKETFSGYHVLGGGEFRLGRWFAVAGEAQWTTVPDALGQNPSSVSAAFDETDLGGTTVRVKFIVGR
jgi:opacity protein-like surface antigen